MPVPSHRHAHRPKENRATPKMDRHWPRHGLARLRSAASTFGERSPRERYRATRAAAASFSVASMRW